MDNENLRLAVYRHFAEGRTPTIAALAADLNTMRDTVRAGLLALANARHLVVGAGGEIVLAHPFSAVPLGFSVMGRDRLWWGGCAWDSFALPHLLPKQGPMLVATTCPACEAPHAWRVDDRDPPPGDQVAHFLVPVRRMWEDVLHTCAHQRIFCDDDCVRAWCERTGNARGAVIDLPTLWRLAQHWYDGRLDRGYRRREPADSATYLRDVGLTGDFWVS